MNWPDELKDNSRAAGWFNKLLRACKSHAVVESGDVAVSEGTHGTLLALRINPGSGGSPLRQLRLKAHGDDWMRCRSWNGTTEGTTDIYVARDPELRRTRFDGKSIAYSSDGDAFTATFAYTSPTKRTKTIAGTAETQVIVPYYVIDSTTDSTSKSTIINAMRSSDPTGVDDPNGNPISLVEVTQRAWAKLEVVT